MSVTVPGLSSRTLDNGLDLLVLENHSAPLVTVEIAVKSGACVEDPEMAGLSHLYEHMFFKGNRALPNQERFMERLRELGASWNGTTGTELVNYYLTVPTENLREAASFLRDALLFPLFKESELDRERVVVLNEFDRSESNPRWHLQHQVDRKMWHQHLSRKVPIGDRGIIETASRQKMLTLQERYYVPNNAALVFAGDVDPQEAFALGAELLGPAVWARGEEPHVRWPVPQHPPLEKDLRLVVLQPVQIARVLQSWHGPSLSTDPKSTYIADLLDNLLNQPASRFQRNLVDTGLFDGISADYYSQKHVGPFALNGVTSAARLDKAHAALQEEVARMADPDYFSEDELAWVQDRLEHKSIFDQERTSEYVHTLAFWWATAGLEYLQTYLDRARQITLQDVSDFVRRFLHQAPSVTGLLLAPQDLPLVKLAEGAETIQPESGSSRTALAAQKQRPRTEAFDVEGLRVILHHKPSGGVVAVRTFIEGGLAAAGPGENGLEMLMLEVAEKASAQFDKRKMARELTRLGATLWSDSQPDSTTFLLMSLRKNLVPSLELYLDALIHPELAEEEVALARERRLTTLGARDQHPDAYADRLSMQAVYGTHPFALDPLGQRDRLAALRASDLRELHHRTIQRSRMILVVAGDVGREELESMLAPAIRDIPQGQFHRPAPQSMPQGPGLIAEERDLPTVYLRGQFAAPNLQHPDFPALYLGLSVLSHRMFDEIRSKRNLSYSPSAWLRRRSANIGTVNISTAEPNACVEILFDLIRGLQRAPVTETRLRNVVSEVRTELLTNLQTAEDLAIWLGDMEVHGGGWSRLQELLDALPQVTPEQMRLAMETHVRGIRFAALGKLEGLDRALLQSFA